MDRQIPTNGAVLPGISMVNGIIKEEEDTVMADANGTLTNGAAKRKVRESLARPSYADAESSDDDQPLVSPPCHPRRDVHSCSTDQKTKSHHRR